MIEDSKKGFNSLVEDDTIIKFKNARRKITDKIETAEIEKSIEKQIDKVITKALKNLSFTR